MRPEANMPRAGVRKRRSDTKARRLRRLRRIPKSVATGGEQRQHSLVSRAAMSRPN